MPDEGAATEEGGAALPAGPDEREPAGGRQIVVPTADTFGNDVEDPGKPTSILWHSNAPWVGTGYGAQSALFAPLLHEQLGYRLAFSAFYGLSGSRLGWQSPSGHNYIVYPGGRHAYGNDVLGPHSQHWFGDGPGMVVTLTDPWVLDARICKRIPLMAWTPIDHDPIMPRTAGWLYESGAIPLAMSRFGEEKMVEAGLEPLYVPHGFDANTFAPEPQRKRLRKLLGIPDSAFVVGMVAANKGVPSRKGFSQAIQAFAEFKKTAPEAVLFLHTRLQDPEGEDITEMCEGSDIRPLASDQYGIALGPPNTIIAGLMNSFDVLLNPSWGEGFGIPMLEAQACGTPVIATNFSAMPEVAPVKEGNWLVGGQRVWTSFGSYMLTPNIEQIVDALKSAYEEPADDREARRASVAQFAHANYESGYVTEKYWRPVLEEAINQIAWRRNRVVRH